MNRLPRNVRGLRTARAQIYSHSQQRAVPSTSSRKDLLNLSKTTWRCCFQHLLGTVVICNKLSTDPLNSLHSWSNLWFAPQRDSDLGPDWEGQMTHVSMIGLHDYKESKWSLVLSVQEWGTAQLSNTTDESLFKAKYLGKPDLSCITLVKMWEIIGLEQRH